MRKPERENQSGLAGYISERAWLSFRAGPVEFQSGPDKKNRPTRNDSSAHQIALFSLLKIKKCFFPQKVAPTACLIEKSIRSLTNCLKCAA